MKKRCPQGTCKDRLMRGGKRVQCDVCDTEFPCAVTAGKACGHYDCRIVRGDPCPQAIDYDPSKPIPVTEMVRL